ncbi:MAG TPA: cyclic nucleotide-binding domain-containing protein [Lacunisphaera sp.]|nr:cyclic nucleotide-binding domain-containing protein [Lacunisphaera sp.]
MAKTASRPTILPGSLAPFTQATRQAEPERWDTPFSQEMTEADVDLVLAHPLFATTRLERFPASISLRGILKNDARIRRFLPGEIIVRRGDYGHSAFIILTGAVRILLKEPPAELLGRRQQVRPSVWGSVKRWWHRSQYPEQSTARGAPPGLGIGRSGEPSIFLQDVPGVLDPDRTVLLQAGELFGEIAAIGRTPRTTTVVAAREAQLLEIRWQGLREIRTYAPEWKTEIDRRYRERSLLRHLAETPLLWNLPEPTLQLIADATKFETFGEFDWHSAYHRAHKAGERERLEQEPVIAREGDYPNGLLLVRSGFARVSSRYNHGERTDSYLGKGQAFGLREIVTGWRGQHVPLRNSLRALGYVDLLFIPTAVLEEHVLPGLTPEQLASLTLAPEPAPAVAAMHEHGGDSFLEFIVAQRFINGRATMLIDLDRCTRCDDCVRACAATHDNNPRFIRQGPEAGGVMVASACMHCVDPVCMIGCPTGAIYRESADGQVGINPDTCIGCSICAQSCPYGTIQMVALRDDEGLPIVTEETGAPVRRATKCDLCIDQPGGPACVSACPHDALLRADMRQVDALTAWLQR